KADRIESGLRKGSEFLNAGNVEKASVEIRNVLQIDPKNPTAYFMAGRIDDWRADLRSAYLNYSRALEIKSDYFEAKIGLAAVYMRGNDLDAARRTLADLSTEQQLDPRVRVVKIALAVRDGDAAQAIAQARPLIDGTAVLPIDSSLLLAAAS